MVRPTDSKFCARSVAAVSIVVSVGLFAATTPAYASSETGLEGPSVFDNVVAQEIAAEDLEAGFEEAIAEMLGTGENAVIAIPTGEVDENGEAMVKVVTVGDEEFHATVNDAIDSVEAGEEAAASADGSVAEAAEPALETAPVEAAQTESDDPAASEPSRCVDMPMVEAVAVDEATTDEAAPECTFSTLATETVSVSTYEQLQNAITNRAASNVRIVLLNTININAPLVVDAGKTVVLDLNSEFAIVPVDTTSFSSFFKVQGESDTKTVIQVLSGSIASRVVDYVVETNNQNVELLFGGDMLYAKTLFDTSTNWKCNLVGEGIFSGTVVVGEGSSLVINEGGLTSKANGCAIQVTGGQVQVSKGSIDVDGSTGGDAAIIVEDGGEFHIYSGSFSCAHGDMFYSEAGSSIKIDGGTFTIADGSIVDPTSEGDLELNLQALDANTIASLLPENYVYEDGKIVYHEPVVEPDPTDPDPDPVDPVDPDPMDPVDPDPTDPVDPAPVDPVEPAPVDPVESAPAPSAPDAADDGSAGAGSSGAASSNDYYYDDGPAIVPIRPATNAAPALSTLGAALQSPDVPLPFTGFYTNSMLDTNDALATRDATEDDSAAIAATTFAKNGAQGAGDGDGNGDGGDDGSIFDVADGLDVASSPITFDFDMAPAPTAAVATGIAAAVLIGVRVSQFTAINAAAAQSVAGAEPKKPKKKRIKKK